MLPKKWIVVILAATIVIVVTSVSILLFWRLGTDENEIASTVETIGSPAPLADIAPASASNMAITLEYRTQPTFQVSVKNAVTTTESSNVAQFAPTGNLFSVLKISANGQTLSEVRFSLPASSENTEIILIVDGTKAQSGTVEILAPSGTLIATSSFNLSDIAQQSPSSTAAFLTETKKIATIPQPYRPTDVRDDCKPQPDCYLNAHRANGMRFSPTGSKVAYRREDSPPDYDAKGSWHIALNDSAISSHTMTSNVLHHTEGVPVFSSDGEHVAYALTDENDLSNSTVVYLDGKEHVRARGTISESWLSFWPNSSDVWYYPGDQETLYHNNLAITLKDPLPRYGAPFQFINNDTLAYQATLPLEGKAIVDAWCEAGIPQHDCKELQKFVACFEEAGGGYGGLACFQGADQTIIDKYMHDTYPDGSVTYWVFLNRNGEVVRTSKRYVSGQHVGSTVEADGVIYSIVRKDALNPTSSLVYLKETTSEIKELFSLSKQGEQLLAVSPDQSKVATSIRQENTATGLYEETLHINGKEVGIYGQVQQFTFSSDSQHYLHISTERGVAQSNFNLIVDGTKYTTDRSVSWARFAPQSSTPIMITTMPGDKTKRMVSVGTQLTSQPYDSIYYSHYATVGNPYPNLSSDGKYVGVGARLGQELWWVTLKLP